MRARVNPGNDANHLYPLVLHRPPRLFVLESRAIVKELGPGDIPGYCPKLHHEIIQYEFSYSGKKTEGYFHITCNTDFPGGDTAKNTHSRSILDCAHQCLDRSETDCASFTYWPEKRTCFMKSSKFPNISMAAGNLRPRIGLHSMQRVKWCGEDARSYQFGDCKGNFPPGGDIGNGAWSTYWGAELTW